MCEGPLNPVFQLRRDLVIRLGVETRKKPVYLSGYTDTAILIRHGRKTIRSVAGTWTHSVASVISLCTYTGGVMVRTGAPSPDVDEGKIYTVMYSKVSVENDEIHIE